MTGDPKSRNIVERKPTFLVQRKRNYVEVCKESFHGTKNLFTITSNINGEIYENLTKMIITVIRMEHKFIINLDDS
jgi:hypothetical protein